MSLATVRSKVLLVAAVCAAASILAVVFLHDGEESGAEPLEPGLDGHVLQESNSGVELAPVSPGGSAESRGAPLVDSGPNNVTASAVEIPQSVLEQFAEVTLDEFELRDWDHQRFLEWGCERAPTPEAMRRGLELRFTHVPLHVRKKVEAASAEVQERAKEVEERFARDNRDLLDATAELVALRVAEANASGQVRTYDGKEALADAVPLFDISTWGYVKAWTYGGEYALIRFDVADDPAIQANFDTLDTFARIRDADLLALANFGG